MRILYGVVGEGMGHATRSRVVIEHLLDRGHEVLVAVSGRAHRFLGEAFTGQPRIHVEEIAGLHLVYEDNEVDRSESLWSNLEQAPEGIRKNLEVSLGEAPKDALHSRTLGDRIDTEIEHDLND